MLAVPALDPLSPQLLTGVEPAHANLRLHGLHEPALGDPERLGERNVARADDVAAPALDAIEEPQILEQIELAVLGGRIELLRQQVRGHAFEQFPQRMHGMTAE